MGVEHKDGEQINRASVQAGGFYQKGLFVCVVAVVDVTTSVCVFDKPAFMEKAGLITISEDSDKCTAVCQSFSFLQ